MSKDREDGGATRSGGCFIGRGRRSVAWRRGRIREASSSLLHKFVYTLGGNVWVAGGGGLRRRDGLPGTGDLACWSPIYRLGRWECRAGRVRVWRAQARAARVRVGIYCGVPATRRDGAARGEKGGDSGAGRRLGYVAGEWEGAGDCRLAFL